MEGGGRLGAILPFIYSCFGMQRSGAKWTQSKKGSILSPSARAARVAVEILFPSLCVPTRTFA